MIEVRFTLSTGEELVHQGRVGESLLDVALDNGVPGIIGQCGGGATCCTCHCWVDAETLLKTPPPTQNELDMLEYAWGRDAQSRLACQIDLTDDLEAVHVTVPAEQS